MLIATESRSSPSYQASMARQAPSSGSGSSMCLTATHPASETRPALSPRPKCSAASCRCCSRARLTYHCQFSRSSGKSRLVASNTVAMGLSSAKRCTTSAAFAVATMAHALGVMAFQTHPPNMTFAAYAMVITSLAWGATTSPTVVSSTMLVASVAATGQVAWDVMGK